MLATTDQIDDFLNLRLPEVQAREMLLALTPDKVDTKTFEALLNGMRRLAIPVPSLSRVVLDCCGTGGSGMSHYNTSTTIAFILAAGGVPVVKFGNRGMTSKSGSFDFLEHLGIPAETPLDRLDEILESAGVVFLFAPQCYPQLARFSALRRSVGVRTVFNYMGPLLNPVKPAFRLLGVSHAGMQLRMAEALAKDGSNQRALLVRGHQTLDELACDGPSLLVEVTSGGIRQTRIERACTSAGPLPDEVLTPETNAAIFECLISGDDTDSYFYHLVCLNAGAGFYAAGKAATIEEGIAYAAGLLKGGKVRETLEKCRRAYAG